MRPPRTFRCVPCQRWFKSRRADGGGQCPTCGSGNIREVRDVPRPTERTPEQRAQLAAGTHVVLIKHGRERIVPITTFPEEREASPAKRATVTEQLAGRKSITVAEAKKLGIV